MKLARSPWARLVALTLPPLVLALVASDLAACSAEEPATTTTSNAASTTLNSSSSATVSDATNREARPIQEKQPENKENEARVPMAYDEERDALLGTTFEERAAFIASAAKVAQDGSLEVPLYRGDDLLVDNEACFILGRITATVRR